MRFLFFVLLYLFPIVLSAKVMTGKVVKIADGDTFTLLINGNEQVKVRIDGIDAPERGQAYSKSAKAYLSSMIWGIHVVATFICIWDVRVKRFTK